MDVVQGLIQGFAVAVTPFNLMLVLIGAIAGTLIGALPGIGPINGVAILLPMAYSLGFPVESALILLAGIYYGAQYGGRISSILLNVPGDAGAVMTAIDGFPMAQQRQAGRALGISAIGSFFGGMFGVIMLTLLGLPMSKLAIAFGPPEYVALLVFAFATLSSMIGQNPIKSLLSLLIGMMIVTIGIDSTTGVSRFTMGSVALISGIDFMVVVIGLFGIGELLSLLEKSHFQSGQQNSLNLSRVSWSDVWRIKWTLVRSSAIGFLIGVLPGTGASVASSIAYSSERSLLNDKAVPKFGEGNPNGLAAPESANNSSVSGAMVPMLTLGVPGSGTTAILMGALLMFEITPGPTLFSDSPDLVWGLIASMFIGNLALLVINLPLVGIFARVLLLPQSVLIPAIAMLSFIGVYSIFGNNFDLFVVLVLGAMGYLFSRAKMPLVPLILGVVLGGLFEDNLRRSLAISGGSWLVLFTPIAIFLYLLALAVVTLPLLRKRKKSANPVAASPAFEETVDVD